MLSAADYLRLDRAFQTKNKDHLSDIVSSLLHAYPTHVIAQAFLAIREGKQFKPPPQPPPPQEKAPRPVIVFTRGEDGIYRTPPGTVW